MVLSAVFCLALLCWSIEASSSFTVEWNNTKQRIDGFGVSCATRPAAPPTSILNLLFDPNIGIGLSLLRSRVSYDMPNATTEINFALAAHRYGVQVWSTPWSPPPQWKSNHQAANGGYLLPQYYQQYATYLANYVSNTLAKGVQLFALSINNEPDNSPGYESCTWNATQMHDFVKILAPALRAKKLQTRILMGESSVWDFGESTLSLGDASTNSLVDIVGTHAYGGSATPSPFAYAKTLWMTEWCDTINTPWDASIASGIRVAIKIHQVLTYSQASAFHYWWTSSSQSALDNQGLLGPLPYYNITKRIYALGQFSKFIRPNWVRIQVTPDQVGNTYISAFRHPTNGSFAIVAINSGTSSSPISLTLSGKNFNGVRSLTPYVTDTHLTIVKGSTVSVGTNQIANLNLSPSSITTFIGCARPGAVAAPPAPSTRNLLPNGDYENGLSTGSWTGTGGTVFDIETSVVHSGKYAANCNLIHSNPTINLLQFNLTAGTYLYTSTWVRKQVSTPFSIQMWIAMIVNGVTSYYSIDKATDNNPTPTWTHLIGGFYIPNGQVTLLNVYLQGPAIGQRYYIDSSVVTLAQVPAGTSSFSTSVSNKDSGTCPAWTGPTTP